MRVLIIPAKGNNIHPMHIESTLYRMQDLVGGFIECAPIPDLNEMGIELIVNEEGLLRGLPVNENLLPFFYVGHAFMVGTDGENFASLTDKQLEAAKTWLANLK